MRKKTWILLADAARARILESIGPSGDLVEIDGYDFLNDLPMNRELGADRPGRGYESVGDVRHAIAPSGEDARRRLKRGFAKEIAGRLSAAVAAKEVQRLVVAAPGTMLGDLRRAFPAAVSDIVVAELSKDLTKIPLADLRSHFDGVVLV